MAQTPTLAVQSRDQFGKSWRAQSRTKNLVPANIVAKGKPSLALAVSYNNLDKILRQVGYTQPVNLVIDEADSRVVLVTKIDFWPTKNLYQHIVFQEVSRHQQVTAQVPLVVTGEAIGVSQSGLLLIQMLDHLEITAGALNLPEKIEVEVTDLSQDGQVVRVGQLKLPPAVSCGLDPRTPVVRLEQSRAAISQDQTPDQAADSDQDQAETAEAGSIDD